LFQKEIKASILIRQNAHQNKDEKFVNIMNGGFIVNIIYQEFLIKHSSFVIQHEMETDVFWIP
jgi:hypothetical protein